MVRAKTACWMAAAGLLIMVALTAKTAGQAAEPNKDTLDALLVEVRGLRAAMEQMASAGPRVQLAIGRLQLQEQRVNTMVRRVDEVRAALASAQNELSGIQQNVARLQNALEDSSITPGDRSAVETQLTSTRQQLARKNADIQRLQAEEGDASSQVTAEQARWTEINQRLEELERALTRR